MLEHLRLDGRSPRKTTDESDRVAAEAPGPASTSGSGAPGSGASGSGGEHHEDAGPVPSSAGSGTAGGSSNIVAAEASAAGSRDAGSAALAALRCSDGSKRGRKGEGGRGTGSSGGGVDDGEVASLTRVNRLALRCNFNRNEIAKERQRYKDRYYRR